ncbi:hypothetical protein Phou_016400 [Phytohabitans houttuyneae]|uniref:DUF932 domain-containing protein n=1 Tax=Phytohabitans houttuyneae TaxID=1076126 RepID=A0A6V8K1J9_9ACTN|nr:DUF932 domain-containing protein [Phytohabitans houttuyneae]GFJ77460.1 hypothetical protein Phou_016400 [Phytohabitans houttuyneae]
MSDTARPADLNAAFAAERSGQIEAAAARQADFDARIASGKLIAVGGGRFRVNDPDSWDHDEILIQQQDGQILPQHGLDTSRGQVALYSSVPAWHALGSVVPGGTSDVEDVLRLGGIDFDVARRPVEFRNSLDGPTRVLSEQFVTVRGDTGAGLGVVGSKYEVLQNRDAFAFLQDLVDRDDVVWESAGAVRGGRKVFVCLRLPDTVTIDAAGIADPIVPFIVALNSHDGSSLFHVVVTPWRPVCANTERFALRDAVTRWGCGTPAAAVTASPKPAARWGCRSATSTGSPSSRRRWPALIWRWLSTGGWSMTCGRRRPMMPPPAPRTGTSAVLTNWLASTPPTPRGWEPRPTPPNGR